MPITAREMLKILKKDGWYIVSQEGSHIQLKHTTKKGKVTVPNHKRGFRNQDGAKYPKTSWIRKIIQLGPKLL